MSIMLPAIGTMKPAPADNDTSLMRRVQPVGAPVFLGSSLKEYCVFAMQMGRPA